MFFFHGWQFPRKYDLPFNNKFLHFYTSFGFFFTFNKIRFAVIVVYQMKRQLYFPVGQWVFCIPHLEGFEACLLCSLLCRELQRIYGLGWGGEQRMGTWGGGGSVNGGSGSGVGEGAQAFTPVVSRTPRNMGLLIWRRIESDNWHDYVKLDISREYLALQLALNLQNSVLIKWPCAAHRAEIYSASNR